MEQNEPLLVEYWPLDRINPYSKNARKISKAAVDKVAKSIQEFGFRQPIVVAPDGVIIVGHVRRMAAAQLGLNGAPVHVATGLTEAQVRQYRLMDNRSHDEARWDADILTLEMQDMQLAGMSLELTGFSGAERDRSLVKPVAGEDDIPAVPETPITKLGDLWSLGDHRLLCGDSTDQPSVARLLGDENPFLMVTDPPYGVSYDSDWRLRAGVNKPWQTLADGTVTNDDQSDWRGAWRLFPGTVAYVWHSAIHSPEVAAGLLAEGFEIRSQIIWAKQSLVIGRGHYHWQHEPCWYSSRSSAHWAGDRKQSTLWQIANMHISQGNVDDGKTVHSTQKPVECMRRPMQNHESAAVYDPFLGSGTTIIAAESLSRRCFGLELEPKYCDLIVNRWEKLTGKKATRAQ